jgi:hypothetical protein
MNDRLESIGVSRTIGLIFTSLTSLSSLRRHRILLLPSGWWSESWRGRYGLFDGLSTTTYRLARINRTTNGSHLTDWTESYCIGVTHLYWNRIFMVMLS